MCIRDRPEVKDITLYTDVIGTIEPSETVTVTPKMSGEALEAVSYTHLDVYKRQLQRNPPNAI